MVGVGVRRILKSKTRLVMEAGLILGEGGLDLWRGFARLGGTMESGLIVAYREGVTFVSIGRCATGYGKWLPVCSVTAK